MIAHGIPAFLLFTVAVCQNVPLRGPPQFENNPQYLDSYIPASMQVIAYLTEMMKYDIKPIVVSTTTTRPSTVTTTKRAATMAPSRATTTNRPAPPTPYHKPALYAPYIPPSFVIHRSPAAPKVVVDGYEEYVGRLKSPLGGYFDRYRHVDSISAIIDQLSRQRRATPFNYTAVPKQGKPREKRAKPFNPRDDDNRECRGTPCQRFVSLGATRRNGTATAPRAAPERGRPRSARSARQGAGPADLSSAPAGGGGTGKSDLQLTLSTESNRTKARALSIDGDTFNARSVDYLGFGLNELVQEIQSEREESDNRLTDDDRVRIFSTKYDDVNFGSYLLRQKKIPPTKAYVTLLSLYDLLNKESKKLMLNKYNGYATAIVEELIETSAGTSSEQLKIILQRIIDRPDTHDQTIRTKITALVTDLSTSNSYINDALRYIPPLPFSR